MGILMDKMYAKTHNPKGKFRPLAAARRAAALHHGDCFLDRAHLLPGHHNAGCAVLLQNSVRRLLHHV